MIMNRKHKFKENCDLSDESMFIDVSSSPTYNSAVWKHFKKNKLEEKAKCNYCGTIMTQRGCTTSGLRHHLTAKHEIKIETKNSKFINNSENQAEMKIENPDNTDEINASIVQEDALLVKKNFTTSNKKIHSLKFKLKIISEAKKSTNLQVAKMHGIDNSMIGKWRKNESKLLELFKSSKNGKKPMVFLQNMAGDL